MSCPNGTDWQDWETAVLLRRFPDEGSKGVQEELPHRSSASIRSKAKAQGVRRRGRWKRHEEAYCLPEQNLLQQLDCVQMRKWRGPVNRTRPLVATIGMAA
jgi:hypothetical protein